MKSLWLREVVAILEKNDFQEWWQSLVDLEQRLSAVQSRYEELLAQVNLMEFRAEFTQKSAIDSLYLAGEYEDTAARLLADAAEIENKSYEAVANFESQRIHVSDLFSRMGAVEHRLLSIETEIRSRKLIKQGADENGEREELERLLRRSEAEAKKLRKDQREATALYERENSRKMSLWEEVEHMWTRSLDINLGVSERRVKSKHARRESERLFKEAEQYKHKAQDLRNESEETKKKTDEIKLSIDNLRSSARKLFGCLVGEEFLYWPRRENNNEVYCVPVNDHAEGFNIELRARNIYLIHRQRGVEFIEPLPPVDETQVDEDRRIDDFFWSGRPGSAPGSEIS
jgi:Txe/YoeB family toxin of Txe-Axe toxin-antitoxin module